MIKQSLHARPGPAPLLTPAEQFDGAGQDVITGVNLAKAYPEYDIGVADASPWTIRLHRDAPITPEHCRSTNERRGRRR
jgi:hypothetical protein